jgi:hypothetical protein
MPTDLLYDLAMPIATVPMSLLLAKQSHEKPHTKSLNLWLTRGLMFCNVYSIIYFGGHHEFLQTAVSVVALGLTAAIEKRIRQPE